MCFKETGLHVQNMIFILGSKANIKALGGGIYDHLVSTRFFTLIVVSFVKYVTI